MNLGFLIDNDACIGCHACSTACKSENQVPIGVYRTWVKVTETGRFPDARRSFQVTRCNHCANAPCVRICPTAAMHQRDDGIVQFDGDACIGCKACIQACPYDAIYIDPETLTAAKCHFCAHRIDVGLEPACVVVCPEHAIISGDLDDPASEISREIAKRSVTVRKPEQGTAPKLFYTEGNALALHPTAIEGPRHSMMFTDPAPEHGPAHPILAPSEPRARSRGPQPQGLPDVGPVAVGGRMAAHMSQVAYNAQHRLHWHWQIPAYLITKHIASGLFALLALSMLTPLLPFSAGAFVGWGGVGLAMMVITLALLVADLDRPDRFFFLFVRPQWRSWVARAAWILTAWSAVAGAWWLWEALALSGVVGAPGGIRIVFAVLLIPLSVLAAVYTAFLFAQAEGRDLWQGGHLPALLGAQALALGAAPLALGGAMAPGARTLFGVALGLSLVITLAGDVATPHATELARRASKEMVWGRYRHHFWAGGILLGHVVPLLLLTTGVGPLILIAALATAVGMFLYAYALVIAPQELPNS